MIYKTVTFIIVFIVEAFTAWIYFEYLFQRKKESFYCIMSFFIGYIILFGITFFNNTWVNSIAFYIINVSIIYLNYNSSLTKMLLNAGFLTFVMLASEMLAVLLLTLFVHDFAAYEYLSFIWIALAILSKLFYFSISLTISRAFGRKLGTPSRESEKTLSLCILPFSSIIIVLTLIYSGIKIRHDTVLGALILISMILLLLANVLVLVVYNRMQSLSKEKTLAQVAFEREAAQAEYYALIKEQYDLQCELIHDIRHHMQTLGDLSKKEGNHAILEYLQQVEEDPALNRHIIYSSNPVINVIVVRYAEQCKNIGISFSCDIREHCMDMLSTKDASIIFHNILSNAVEAAAQSKEKSIELSVFSRKEQSVDVISLSNSCDYRPKLRKDGLLETHKKDDPSRHGIGLRSVKHTLKNYNGALILYFEENKNQFFTTISIPR